MMRIRKSTKAFLVALVLVAPHMEPWVAIAAAFWWLVAGVVWFALGD